MGTGDYRQILRAELAERCRRNPRYSLRAFARDLGLDPARLSDALNGKKGFSRPLALELAGRLGLQKHEAEAFADSVEAQHARSKAAKQAARERLQKRASPAPRSADHSLSVDAFKTISEWYPLAIVHLLKLSESRAVEPGSLDSWIAQRLGLNVHAIRDALERLERLGMIERASPSGRFQAAPGFLLSTDGIPSDAIKKHHEQILERAQQALYTVPVPERDFSSLLIPTRADRIPEIRRRLREFARALSEEFGESATADQIYSVSMQAVPLLQPALRSPKEKK